MFNVKGNDYRLVVAVNYRHRIVGVLLVLGLLTRLAGLVASGLLASLWVSEWGTAWIGELLVPTLVSLALAVGRAGRT